MPIPALPIPRKKLLMLIWSAFVGSLLGYGVVHCFVINGILAIGVEEIAPAGVGSWLLAAAITSDVAAWGWYRMKFAAVARGMTATTLASFSEAQRLTTAQRLVSDGIVVMALLETPALIGLVNTFLGSPHPWLFESMAMVSLGALCWLARQGTAGVFPLLDRLEQGVRV